MITKPTELVDCPICKRAHLPEGPCPRKIARAICNSTTENISALTEDEVHFVRRYEGSMEDLVEEDIVDIILEVSLKSANLFCACPQGQEHRAWCNLGVKGE